MGDVHALSTLEFVKRMAEECQIPKTMYVSSRENSISCDREEAAANLYECLTKVPVLNSCRSE